MSMLSLHVSFCDAVGFSVAATSTRARNLSGGRFIAGFACTCSCLCSEVKGRLRAALHLMETAAFTAVNSLRSALDPLRMELAKEDFGSFLVVQLPDPRAGEPRVATLSGMWSQLLLYTRVESWKLSVHGRYNICTAMKPVFSLWIVIKGRCTLCKHSFALGHVEELIKNDFCCLVCS